MAENSWHRYDMKKLRHCHPMYIILTTKDIGKIKCLQYVKCEDNSAVCPSVTMAKRRITQTTPHITTAQGRYTILTPKISGRLN